MILLALLVLASASCARSSQCPGNITTFLKRQDTSRCPEGTKGLPFSGCLSDGLERDLAEAVRQPETTVSGVHCGFNTIESLKVLQGLRKLAAGCEAVVFTVSFGDRAPMRPSPILIGESARAIVQGTSELCLIAVMDLKVLIKLSESEDLAFAPACANMGEKEAMLTPGCIQYDGWRIIRAEVSDLGLDTAARAAHILKTLVPRIFKSARYAMYADAKSPLPLDPLSLLRSFRHEAFASYDMLVMKNTHYSTDLFGEFIATVAHLASRMGTKPNTMVDFDDIFRAYAFYRRSGAPLHGTGMIDAQIILYNIRRLEEEGSCLMALSCLWANQVARYSMREQLSFHYVMWLLGAHDGIGVIKNYAEPQGPTRLWSHVVPMKPLGSGATYREGGALRYPVDLDPDAAPEGTGSGESMDWNHEAVALHALQSDFLGTFPRLAEWQTLEGGHAGPGLGEW